MAQAPHPQIAVAKREGLDVFPVDRLGTKETLQLDLPVWPQTDVEDWRPFDRARRVVEDRSDLLAG